MAGKNEIALVIATSNQISAVDGGKWLDASVKAITQLMATGDPVTVPGLGTFQASISSASRGDLSMGLDEPPPTISFSPDYNLGTAVADDEVA